LFIAVRGGLLYSPRASGPLSRVEASDSGRTWRPEALDVASVSSSSPRRHGRDRYPCGASWGPCAREDTEGYDPEKVRVVREALFRYSPATERVLERLASKCGTIEKDEGLRLYGR
jgi:hypothetical protein